MSAPDAGWASFRMLRAALGARPLTALAAASLALAPLPGVAQQAVAPPGGGCGVCHGEVEFLRQRVGSLDRARALVATPGQVEGSAHRGMACADCHSGFARFPHVDGSRTRDCASCHEESHGDWSAGVHAEPDREGAAAVGCADCHGVHDVRGRDDVREGAGMREMNRTCVSCHGAAAPGPEDPHTDSVACASCHAPHRTRDVADPEARVAPAAQAATCGTCHAEPADHWGRDAHGEAFARRAGEGIVGLAEQELWADEAPPSCTSCHGGHGMSAPGRPDFESRMVDACASCHREYADRYFGTYHGKATALGSEIVATCDDCHGAHTIRPAAAPESSVGEANLVETCGACHDHARPTFVEYDSHPDPMDRGRNPALYFSFVFMNAVLLGVVVVFGLHTLLWWVRLQVDRRKGVEHGIGGGHDQG